MYDSTYWYMSSYTRSIAERTPPVSYRNTRYSPNLIYTYQRSKIGAYWCVRRQTDALVVRGQLFL